MTEEIDDSTWYEYVRAHVDEYRFDPMAYFYKYLNYEDVEEMTGIKVSDCPVCLAEPGEPTEVLSLPALRIFLARRAPSYLGDPDEAIKHMVRETPADYLVRKWAENPGAEIVPFLSMLGEEPGIPETQAQRIRDAFEIETVDRLEYTQAIERCGLTYDDALGRWTYPEWEVEEQLEI